MHPKRRKKKSDRLSIDTIDMLKVKPAAIVGQQ